MKNLKSPFAGLTVLHGLNTIFNFRRKNVFSAAFIGLFLAIAISGHKTQTLVPDLQAAKKSPFGLFNLIGDNDAGSGMSSFVIASNNAAPIETIAVGGQSFALGQTDNCTYSITPNTAFFGIYGGTGFFNVMTQNGCPYNPESSDAFIITNGAGVGNGIITFTVLSNFEGPERTGTINVNGQIFTITQAANQTGGCNPTVVFSSSNFSHLGGSGNLSINCGPQGTYSVTSQHDFITIKNGTGTGSGTVNFTIAPNPGGDRLGSILINGFLGYTITQTGGCSVFLNTTSASFSPSGGTGSIPVTVNDGCPFSATTTDPFITITNGTGTGSGTVDFTIAPNEGDVRTGRITVNNRTFNVSQTGTCPTTLSPASMTFSPGGGTGSFNVTTLPECAYAATTTAPHITISNGTGIGSGTVTFSINANTGTAGRRNSIVVNNKIFSIQQTAYTTTRKVAFDFDGDRKSDIGVFRPDSGNWYLLNSQSGFSGAQFGLSTDTIVPGYYDSDGKTDYAVYRGGNWYIQTVTAGFMAFSFGAPTDIPISADFDGDGRSEIGVYRPSNGTWYLYNIATRQISSLQFGTSEDKPVAGDYDGDFKADVAVFRPSNGTWYLLRSTAGFTSVQFGDATDKPVAADYDGDGKTDTAVFRPSNGTWYLLRSVEGFAAIQFGSALDLPSPADYDGDGKTDIAVFRNGIWYQKGSSSGFTAINFGAAGDKPVPNAFVR